MPGQPKQVPQAVPVQAKAAARKEPAPVDTTTPEAAAARQAREARDARGREEESTQCDSSSERDYLDAVINANEDSKNVVTRKTSEPDKIMRNKSERTLFAERNSNKAALQPKDTWAEEMWATATISFPLALAGIAKTLQQTAIAVVLGRHDTQMLTAVSVAAIWTNITEVVLGSGMGQLMALCSQAVGAGNNRMVSTWVHIGLCFVTVLAMPLASLRWFTAPVLQFLGVDPTVAEMAGTYTIYAQSVLLFDLWYHTFRVYYSAQAIVMPDVINDVSFIFVAYFFMHIACFTYDADIVGVAIAVALTWSLRTLVFISGSFFMGYHEKTWHRPECDDIFVWSRWTTLVSMVVPAGIAGIAEQAQLQASMLISARNGVTVAAGYALVSNVIMLSFIFAFSIAGATGIRVTRFLGEGKAHAAQCAAQAGISLVVLTNVLCGILFAIFAPAYARMASTDPAVWEQVDAVRYVGGFNMAVLGGMVVLAHVIMKQGRPHVVAGIVPVFTWFIGLPLSYNLAKGHGVLGILGGMCVGYTLAFVSLFAAFNRTDWKRLGELARARAEVIRRSPSGASLGRSPSTGSLGGTPRGRSPSTASLGGTIRRVPSAAPLSGKR